MDFLPPFSELRNLICFRVSVSQGVFITFKFPATSDSFTLSYNPNAVYVHLDRHPYIWLAHTKTGKKMPRSRLHAVGDVGWGSGCGSVKAVGLTENVLHYVFW